MGLLSKITKKVKKAVTPPKAVRSAVNSGVVKIVNTAKKSVVSTAKSFTAKGLITAASRGGLSGLAGYTAGKLTKGASQLVKNTKATAKGQAKTVLGVAKKSATSQIEKAGVRVSTSPVKTAAPAPMAAEKRAQQQAAMTRTVTPDVEQAKSRDFLQQIFDAINKALGG